MIQLPMLKKLEEVVTQCGQLVCRLSEDARSGAQGKDEQLGQHFSTRADRESQALGLKLFAQYFPGEVVIAEEQDNAGVPKDCIVLDPLDGTTNFFNDIVDYGVTACALRDGRPVAAATYFASNQSVLSAARGEGCFEIKDGKRRKIENISWHGQLDKTQIGTDIGSWTHRAGTFETVLRPLSERFNILSSMSAIEGGRRVLLGQLGAYYSIGIAKIWDAAAMCLAIEEAGGVVRAPNGLPMRWDSLRCDWVVAINQELADNVLQYTRAWTKVR